MAGSPLKILITADIHAQLALDKKNRRPGLARLAAYVKSLRQNGPVLLFDAGDLMSGSIYGATDLGQTVASLVGRLGYRAFLPGNHDFDHNPEAGEALYYFEELWPRAKKESPELEILALNLLYKGQTPPGVQNLILVQDEPRVAITGIPCPLTQRPSLGSILKDFDFGLRSTLSRTKEEILASLAKILAPFDKPTDITIVLAHLGSNLRGTLGLSGQMSLDFANTPLGPDLTEVPNVTLVVDGHSHEVIEPSRPRHKAWYVNLGQGLEALAEITIHKSNLGQGDFSQNGFSLELKTYADLMDLEPEPTLAKLIFDLDQRLGLNEKLLTLPPEAPYSLSGLWSEIIPLGQLVVEAMAEGAQTQIAFLNKGALRASLEGQVTVGSLRQVLPFSDRLLKASLSGATILKLIHKFSQKGFKGLPLYHGLNLWVYPLNSEDDLNGPLGLAGLSLADGQELKAEKTYSLALSGQMARLLADNLPSLTEEGQMFEAVLALVRARSQKIFLHDPSSNPYRLFESQEEARKAFEERFRDLP
ncbi:MAG: 5'-nucleotidase C-terminal domain-containing protein [Deltaproteobacteria bacterium]|jgi:2',3'-cyclic-nucleotide 2'-phosphodiesterase (5'-nucleotidase family)|nr:5'-nucleotidase C-terminal domain-containing protein [Deltaproteobacteria bacterium]